MEGMTKSKQKKWEKNVLKLINSAESFAFCHINCALINEKLKPINYAKRKRVDIKNPV
jgi:hypothetical protein